MCARASDGDDGGRYGLKCHGSTLERTRNCGCDGQGREHFLFSRAQPPPNNDNNLIKDLLPELFVQAYAVVARFQHMCVCM